MKKLKLLCGFFAVSLLAGIVMYSCQNDGTDAYYFGEEELTAADLFVASEAYQHMRRELKKDRIRMLTAFSQFTPEESFLFDELNSVLINSENISEREEAKERLSELLGFDYQKRLSGLFELTRKTYEGVSFTQLELMKAQQKYRMEMIQIPTRSGDKEQEKEAIEKTKKDCDDACDDRYEPAKADCWNLFGPGKITLEELQIMEKCAETVQSSWDSCLKKCQDDYDAAMKALEED